MKSIAEISTNKIDIDSLSKKRQAYLVEEERKKHEVSSHFNKDNLSMNLQDEEMGLHEVPIIK